MKNELLEKMQEESRQRYMPDLMAPETANEATIHDVNFIEGNDIEAAKRLLGIKTPQKSELEKGINREKVRIAATEKPKNDVNIDYSKVREAADGVMLKPKPPRELPVTPDAKPIFKRPPAIYTNIDTPYGIAKEVHG